MSKDNQQIIEGWTRYCNSYWAVNNPKYFSKGKAKDSKVVLEVPLNFGEKFILKALSSQESEFLKKHEEHTKHHIKLREKALRTQESELKAQWRTEIKGMISIQKNIINNGQYTLFAWNIATAKKETLSDILKKL